MPYRTQTALLCTHKYASRPQRASSASPWSAPPRLLLAEGHELADNVQHEHDDNVGKAADQDAHLGKPRVACVSRMHMDAPRDGEQDAPAAWTRAFVLPSHQP